MAKKSKIITLGDCRKFIENEKEIEAVKITLEKTFKIRGVRYLNSFISLVKSKPYPDHIKVFIRKKLKNPTEYLSVYYRYDGYTLEISEEVA